MSLVLTIPVIYTKNNMIISLYLRIEILIWQLNSTNLVTHVILEGIASTVIMEDYSRWIWLCSLLTRMSPLRSFLNSIKGFKMKREYALLQSKLVMVESLKTRAFIYYVKRMELFITFVLLEHLNKMVLLRERIDHCKK